MNPWIENVSLADIRKGFHYDPSGPWGLISIVDPDMDFPIPKYQPTFSLKEKFLDLEEDHPDAIQEDQAKRIAFFLKDCLDKSIPVIVHCVAGVCRSGAVAEIGEMIGFTSVEKYRSPNLRVKHFLMKELL